MYEQNKQSEVNLAQQLARPDIQAGLDQVNQAIEAHNNALLAEGQSMRPLFDGVTENGTVVRADVMPGMHASEPGAVSLFVYRLQDTLDPEFGASLQPTPVIRERVFRGSGIDIFTPSSDGETQIHLAQVPSDVPKIDGVKLYTFEEAKQAPLADVEQEQARAEQLIGQAAELMVESAVVEAPRRRGLFGRFRR